ncbi:MAG: hypothetical protein ACRDTV_10225 [Mycobacterium sp.]
MLPGARLGVGPGVPVCRPVDLWTQQAKPAILTDDGHLITEDGAVPITNRCNTGGWAQYG